MELSQATKNYLREIETLDVRAVEYYFDDSRDEIVDYDHLNPSQHPNLKQYRVVTLWDLRHYSQKGSGYEKQIRLVVNEIADYEKIPLLKVERINETYLRFWKWYGEQAKLQRENRFETFEFILGLSSFFVCLSDEREFAPNTHSLAPRFLKHLHDAAMFKHSTLKRLIQEIKAISPPAVASTGAKGSNPKTVKKEKDYFDYTNEYVDLRRSVKPIYNRERAIEAVLKKCGISERTLSRALDANSETLLKFGHEEKNFKKFSRVKWS